MQQEIAVCSLPTAKEPTEAASRAVEPTKLVVKIPDSELAKLLVWMIEFPLLSSATALELDF